MLGLGYQVLVQDVHLLTTRQLVNLIRTAVRLTILRTLWICPGNLTVGISTGVVLVHSGTLTVIEDAVV